MLWACESAYIIGGYRIQAPFRLINFSNKGGLLIRSINCYRIPPVWTCATSNEVLNREYLNECIVIPQKSIILNVKVSNLQLHLPPRLTRNKELRIPSTDLNAKPEHVESVVYYCTSSYLQEGVSKDSVWLETNEYLQDALQSVLQDMEVIGTDIARRTDELATKVGSLEQAVEAISHRLWVRRRWAASENLSDLTVPVTEPPALAKVATVAGDDRPINCRPLAPYSRMTLDERLKNVYCKREAPPPLSNFDSSSHSVLTPSMSVSSKNGSTRSNSLPPLPQELSSRPLSSSVRRSSNGSADKSNLDLSNKRSDERSREQAARLSVPRPSLSGTGAGQVPFRPPRVKSTVSSGTTRTSIGSARDRPAQKPPSLLSKRPPPPPKLSAASRSPEYESPPPTPPKPQTSYQPSPPLPPPPPLPSSGAGDMSDVLVLPPSTEPPPPDPEK